MLSQTSAITLPAVLLSDAFVALLENRGRTMEAACIGGLTRRFRALPEIAAPLPDTHAFGALIATTRMIGSGDGIRAENGEEVGFTDTAEIDMRSPFFLRGWALRTDGYVAVDRVIVTINGGTVAGAISEQRGDIVQLYGRQAGLAGFIARVPGSSRANRSGHLRNPRDLRQHAHHVCTCPGSSSAQPITDRAKCLPNGPSICASHGHITETSDLALADHRKRRRVLKSCKRHAVESGAHRVRPRIGTKF